MNSPVLLVDDPVFAEHENPFGSHPERPERLAAARDAIESAREAEMRFELVPARAARPEELCLVHDEAYVESLEELRGCELQLDPDTYIGEHTVDAALRAAGGCVDLVHRLITAGEARQGVALVRPPGHHATPARGMGFCLLNNAAIAARAALDAGLERVAIVDWDVHHGNGTQDAFYDDPRVLYVSLHQVPLYPGTGDPRELGREDGRGFNANLALSADAGDATYAAAFHQVVTPLLTEFGPDLVLVSAGFDAHLMDPLAAMRVSDAGFHAMAHALREVADRTAKGRMALLLEGGYALEAIRGGLSQALLGMAGTPPCEADVEAAARSGADVMLARHGDEITSARKLLKSAWPVL